MTTTTTTTPPHQWVAGVDADDVVGATVRCTSMLVLQQYHVRWFRVGCGTYMIGPLPFCMIGPQTTGHNTWLDLRQKNCTLKPILAWLDLKKCHGICLEYIETLHMIMPTLDVSSSMTTAVIGGLFQLTTEFGGGLVNPMRCPVNHCNPNCWRNLAHVIKTLLDVSCDVSSPAFVMMGCCYIVKPS